MRIDLSAMKLPQIYVRNKKDCYLDPIRKKLIYITPEETVRQQVVSYLLNELNIPANMITVEAHLSHYGIKSKQRADIIIHALADDGTLYPIAMVTVLKLCLRQISRRFLCGRYRMLMLQK